MGFFTERRKIKKDIEKYVAVLKNVYGEGSIFLERLCKDAEVELIQYDYIYNVRAFKFENGPKGVVYGPHLPDFPLIYGLTKKVGHHILEHFERQLPIYIVETEAHYFASAVINLPFISLRCIHSPSLHSLLASEKKIKRDLASCYSLDTKPVLL